MELTRRSVAGVAALVLGAGCAPAADDAMLRPHTGFAPVPGGRVWYEVAGEGSGTRFELVRGPAMRSRSTRRNRRCA